jgi:hypothetical protein
VKQNKATNGFTQYRTSFPGVLLSQLITEAPLNFNPGLEFILRKNLIGFLEDLAVLRRFRSLENI